MYVSVTGKCPNCGYEKAQFLNIDSNDNIAVDCPRGNGCNYQASTPLRNALQLIDTSDFPLQLR